MLSKLSYNIAIFLFRNKLCNEDNFEIYKYGIEQIISSLYTIISVIIIGIITNKFVPCMIFLISFVLLRRFSGGYHADTYLKCYISFIALIITFIIIIDNVYLANNPKLILIFTVISTLLIILFSPIENVNKPFNNEKRIKFKKISTIIVLIEFLITLVSFKTNSIYIISIQANIIIVAVLQILQLIKLYYKGGDKIEKYRY